MKQVTGPTQRLVIAIGYVEPRDRDSCARCKYSKPETANSRLRCTVSSPMITVNKMGICRFYTRDRSLR